MRWNTILHECKIFVRIHCFNSRDYVITEMLQVGGSVHFDSISINKERLTNTFPCYHSGCHNLFRKFVSFAFRLHIFLGPIKINSIVLAISWYLKGKVLLSHLETRAVVKSGWKKVEEAFQHVRLSFYGMLNSSEVFLNVCSNEDSFSWPSDELMICWSISEVWFAWWNCGYQLHLLSKKLGYSFQILYAFQPFSLKPFSMTAFCLSVKTILLRSSELGNCETFERRPVTSTDFDLHCNGFLHCHDFFTRQRRKKTS